MVLAGIQINKLDTGLRLHAAWYLDTHLCGVVLSTVSLNKVPNSLFRHPRAESGISDTLLSGAVLSAQAWGDLLNDLHGIPHHRVSSRKWISVATRQSFAEAPNRQVRTNRGVII
jgi:hypothetical protein